MAETKYGKYVIQRPVEVKKFGPELTFSGERDFHSEFSIMFFHISEPVLMEESPHSHDFDMYLVFMGTTNMEDLSAEVELGLGEEQEIHTITAPTSVYVPKGLVHCPLNFKRVDKPILFIHIIISPTYSKKQY